MREIDQVFAALKRSRFRQRFRLGSRERAYLSERGMATILAHGRDFIAQRLAPAALAHDGAQTPMRGHPVFIAQHATAVCCRACLAKWHDIPAGRELSEAEQAYEARPLAAPCLSGWKLAPCSVV
jgi:hypothetical protein